jgi:hypothetical protein
MLQVVGRRDLINTQQEDAYCVGMTKRAYCHLEPTDSLTELPT